MTPATATSMLKRLAGLGLVDYMPYKGVTLTPAGEKVALEVIRHHRLIEAYLSEALGMPADRVHEEAEVLEHYISEELELLIAAKLGEPSHDPHGTPIPGPDLLPPAGEAELMARRAEFRIASSLRAEPAAVWDRATSAEGINAELGPLLRMTVPRGLESLDLRTLEPGPSAAAGSCSSACSRSTTTTSASSGSSPGAASSSARRCSPSGSGSTSGRSRPTAGAR